MLAFGGVTVATLLVLTVVSSWLWGRALQPSCRDIPRLDLTLQQMVDVKLKVDESERNDSAPIRLSGPEASFLLRDVLRLPAFLQVEGDQLHLIAAIPYRDGCYNVDYEGSVRIHGGVAALAPSRFVVGDLDLASWTRGDTQLDRLAWWSSEAAEVLSHLQEFHVEGGEIVVDVDDVRALR